MHEITPPVKLGGGLKPQDSPEQKKKKNPLAALVPLQRVTQTWGGGAGGGSWRKEQCSVLLENGTTVSPCSDATFLPGPVEQAESQ